MVVFAVAGAVGGRYSYACSEGLSATCRSMEWHLQLPVHHYIHIASGIVEFAALTTAAVIAMRRTRGDGTPEARFYAAVVKVLAVCYPLLGVVYLTDRLGILVEPIFFITFSAVVLAEVFEPTRHRGEWAGVGRAGGLGPGRSRTEGKRPVHWLRLRLRGRRAGCGAPESGVSSA